MGQTSGQLNIVKTQQYVTYGGIKIAHIKRGKHLEENIAYTP